jgi:hypothetical protein
MEEQILRCRREFEDLLSRMAQATGREPLDGIERGTFAELMNLGRALLEVRVQAEAAQDQAAEICGPDGQRRPRHSERTIPYRSVFGEIEIRRAYYWREGVEGWCPLDARLNVPAMKDSYLLQEWALRMGAAQSYDEVRGGLKELLGLEIPKRQLEQMATSVGPTVREFYEEPPKPEDKEGPILVVQADGKGVPMKKEVAAEEPKRLKKGQKRQKKKMALVGVVYSSERREADLDAPLPPPRNKEVFAELQNKKGFGQELFDRAKARERGARKKAFLADGQKTLWDLKEKYFKEYEGILDWMHAAEYLWKAAYLFLPESSPQAIAWVERQEGRFVRGEVKKVIGELKRLLDDGTIRGEPKRKACRNVIAYYRRNQKRMRYDRYLRRGLPIGTGAVEGACRHFVKDRMEGSGMRWTISGAQAVLNLRGAYLSDHWKRFWACYRAREARRQYGSAASAVVTMEKGNAA